MSTLGCSCGAHLWTKRPDSAAIAWWMRSPGRGHLEAQNDCRQPQGLRNRQQLVERKESAAAFRPGQVAASNAAPGPHRQLRLANSTTIAQGPEQNADPDCKLLLVIFRIGIEQRVEFKTHVIQSQGTLAPDTGAVPRKLASMTSRTGDSFAVTN